MGIGTSLRKTCYVGAALAALAIAGSALASHSWNDFHWARTANPFPLQVVDSVTPAWQGEYDTALSEWSVSSVLDLATASTDDARRTRRQCRPVAGRMRVCNDAYGRNGWLGLATIGLDSQGHIDRGTAKMNDTYAQYWTNANEKRHVMCQEIGHVLGLGHTSEDGSSQDTCMDYSQSPTSMSPNAHDYAELESIYAHVDSYDSFASASVAFAQTNVGELPVGVPAGAALIHSSRYEEVYQMGRPDGGRWIFHVRLAPQGGN